MPVKTFDVALTGLTAMQIDVLYDAIAAVAHDGSDQSSVDLDAIVDAVYMGALRAGLTLCLDGYMADKDDCCPACGRDTTADNYAPAPSCFDMAVGACGYWRNQGAIYRAQAAYRDCGTIVGPGPAKPPPPPAPAVGYYAPGRAWRS